MCACQWWKEFVNRNFNKPPLAGKTTKSLSIKAARRKRWRNAIPYKKKRRGAKLYLPYDFLHTFRLFFHTAKICTDEWWTNAFDTQFFCLLATIMKQRWKDTRAHKHTYICTYIINKWAECQSVETSVVCGWWAFGVCRN